ncbi:PKD domain-containing protein [Roseateles cellulosilyticus]|uniref:Ig-like domain-containing protein n=1 Tax=Pelomonas cellulosilytica TaxID=2906762 RepID=A0ABS8XTK9_9BURK|nr:hypothetical protein [Pelomonas sp. P8]MCE4555050.1 hypothetical protein [Pelomonas sp. P8]
MANPLRTQAGSFDFNGDNWFDIPFSWSTASVRDAGTYRYLVECTFTTDGATLQNCTPTELDLVVFNSPPTANITVAGTPAVGQTITLSANSGDADGGSLAHLWRIVAAPASRAAVLASPSAATTTLTFVDERDIGNWTIELDVDDDEGERKTFSTSFRIENLLATVSINGATSIDALQLLQLAPSTTVDPDGGPPLTIRWNILQSPPGASAGPQSDYQSAQPCAANALCIPTTDRDIGTWRIELVATDNENGEVRKTATVEVANLPPKITLSTADKVSIKLGQSVTVSNTTPDDPDGGTVTHDWELVQAPVSAGAMPGHNFRNGPDLVLSTPEAGTWIFTLHIADNDHAANSNASQTVTVAIDGPVSAMVTGAENVALTSPVVLDGSGSVDADAPCTPADPACGHVSSTGAISGVVGVTSYDWQLVDVPIDYVGEISPGPVDYIRNVANGAPTLSIPAGALRPGSWTFQLEVKDDEDNRDATTFRVTVLPLNSAPLAIAVSTGYVVTDVAGQLSTAVGATGLPSFDLDNLATAPYSPGLGISRFEWQYQLAPFGCTAVPPPPAPGNAAQAATFVLYPAGSTVPTACQGSYLLGLLVTDDEMPPNQLSGFTTIPLSVGNCPSEICIDYPTTANYKFLQAGDSAGAFVFYHLNAALYANPAFAQSVRLEFALFHESDTALAQPVYTGQVDYDVLAASLGGYGVAHWHGYASDGKRPPAGRYTVRLRAGEPLQSPVFFEALQPLSIWLEVVDVSIGAGSDSLLSLNRLATANDALRIDYAVSATYTAGPAYDEAWLHIRTVANPNVIAGSIRIPTPFTGTFRWNGELSPGRRIDPGAHTAEIEIRKAGNSLATSPRHAFTAYRIDLQVDGTPAARKQSPGALLDVNGAPTQMTLKLEPATLSGSVTLRTSGNAASTEIKEGATVLATDAGVVQPASGYAAPKVFTVKMLAGTSNPTRFEATYAPTGNPAGKDAQDYVGLNGFDFGLRPFCSDDATNATTGAFVARNPTPLAGNFDQLKFVMLPINVVVQPMEGSTSTDVTLDYEHGSAATVALYEAAGAHAAVGPKTWTQADFDPVTHKLDVKLLANGVAHGEVVLRLQYKADGNLVGEKKLKLRVGDSPGLAGLLRPTYPEFLYQRVLSVTSAGTSPVTSALDPARYVDRVGRKATVYLVRHKSAAEWAIDSTITPLVPAQVVKVDAAGVSMNVSTFGAVPANDLRVEQGYDVVYDFGSCPADPNSHATDQRLDPGDIVDSVAPEQPSVVVLPNDLAPAPPGAVASFEYGVPPTPPSAPQITTDPVSQNVMVGNSATFTVAASGAGRTYQWQRNGIDIVGAVAASYTTNPAVLADHGARYRCVVRNNIGGIAGVATSAEAVLRVPAAPLPAVPVVTADPTGQTMIEGRTTATFSVTATGANLHYQWQKNGVDIAGATAANYTSVPQPISEDGSKYRCVVANVDGSVVSAEATLHVAPVTTTVTMPYDGLAAAFNFRLRGRVAYPSALPPKVPLLAIAHGNHLPLWVNSGAGWVKVANTTDENFRGHTYLQDVLAAHDIASVSVDLDQMVGNWPGGQASSIGYPDIDVATSGILLRANVLLRTVEELLSNATIAGPLAGHLDPNDIHLLGHSRGGEAVIVAANMLSGAVAPPPGTPPFTALGVRSVTSLAPTANHTVNAPLVVPPVATPFLLLYGSADGDVSGASPRISWPFAHFDATTGPAHQIYLRGANHNAWNTSWPTDDAAPPLCGPVNPVRLLGDHQRSAASAYVLALMQTYRLGQPAYGAYFSTPPSLLRPAGLPDDSVLPLMGATRRNAGPGKVVLDDYQSHFPDPVLSSANLTVSSTLPGLNEVELADLDLPNEVGANNRFFQKTNGAALRWATVADEYAVQLAPGSSDLRGASLALRLALRPPNGVAVVPDTDFSVTLIDNAGGTSTVNASAWRRVRGTYPTNLCGRLTTKAAFETFVFPWWAFVANGRALDLSQVATIRFNFALPAGAVGVDDLEIWK